MSRPASGDDEVLMSAREAIASAQTVEQLRQAQAVVLPVDFGLSLADTAQVIGVSPGWACQLRRRLQRHRPARGQWYIVRRPIPVAIVNPLNSVHCDGATRIADRADHPGIAVFQLILGERIHCENQVALGHAEIGCAHIARRIGCRQAQAVCSHSQRHASHPHIPAALH